MSPTPRTAVLLLAAVALVASTYAGVADLAVDGVPQPLEVGSFRWPKCTKAEDATVGLSMPAQPMSLDELVDFYHANRVNAEAAAAADHAQERAHVAHTAAPRYPTWATVDPADGVCGDPVSQISADHVWAPTDDGYDTSRLNQYASMLGSDESARASLKPALVVICSKEAHVQSAVRFAKACGFKVAARSGGHSYTGASSCNTPKCMQLDLGAMDSISVKGNGLLSSKGTVTTGPGIKLIDYAKKTMKHLLSTPHGGCSGVGFGGHFQSSAWGLMSQSHGSGLDHVQSFRLVQADGEVAVLSRDDTNSTHYKAVLGSAPGSWGVITEYTVDAVADRTVPHTRMIWVNMVYSKANLLAAWRQTMFIVKDQEEKNLRDMKILLIAGPASGGKERTPKLQAYMLWTGVDSGAMTKEWRDRYLTPFYQLEHICFPYSLDMPMPLSVATRFMVDHWVNRGDKYAFSAMHSDYWWDDEMIQMIADEVEERFQMLPDAYPNFQFLPLGHNSQWARNAGLNSLTWRDTRSYVDDWMFVTNPAKYDEVVERMRAFREKTRSKWEFKQGVPDRSTWMSPSTIYPDATNLNDPTVARRFFPDEKLWDHLQLVKAEMDPTDLFSNRGTIPLPKA